MAREPITTPTQPTKSRHTFRNFMLLVLFALLLWCWFNYLPNQAIQTLDNLNSKAWTKINSWMNLDTPIPQEIINAPIVVQSATLSGSSDNSGSIASGSAVSGDIISGSVVSGDTTLIIDSGNTIVDVTKSGTLQSGASSSVWQEIDNTAPTQDPYTQDTSSTTNNTSQTQSAEAGEMSLQIGGKTIIIDGNPDEDIVINANGYRIIVQKN